MTNQKNENKNKNVFIYDKIVSNMLNLMESRTLGYIFTKLYQPY